MPTTRRCPATLTAGAVLLVTGCAELQQLPDRLFDNRSPRERYETALSDAGLDRTALVQDWLTAAERALFDAPVVAAGHTEEGFLEAAEPLAIGYRVALRRGQAARFSFTMHGDSVSQVFLEVWEATTDSSRPFRQVATADSGARELELEPRRDGDYVFRAQLELLRGGRFTVRMSVSPTLAFPVQGGRESDIGSRFGDPRDGGSRRHHGIDIFARRGAPVVAATVGTVRRVGTTDIGGNVVWLRDIHGQSLYYAHLDRFIVTAGDQVVPGDTLGFVGNTGNARTTPPHLHFGVYQRGPQDPYWFVHRPRAASLPLSVDTSLVGGWVRTSPETVTVRSEPDPRAAEVTVLPRATAVRVVSAVGGWYRVRLPDARTGYLTGRLVEPTLLAIDWTGLPAGEAIRRRPDLPGRPEEEVARAAGDSMAVFGRFGSALLVRTPGGREGWVGR